MEWVLMFVGFAIAAYAVVANDSIQTLGTFLASNRHRPWWQLWMYAASILVAVLLYGWWTSGGDAAYGRLEKIPLPEHFSWIYLVPPVALLLLTRKGIPVSTTFLILTIFAPKGLGDMLMKSVAGYALAFVLAIGIYFLVSQTIERRFLDTASAPPSTRWVVVQWLSTAFLWSMWLVQDLSNVFVYMPRRLPVEVFAACVVLIIALQGWTFYAAGGAIQRVVTSKTNTQDIRSATIIDFLYGMILLVFKTWNNVPMSTTWVFLGLLAGREIAMAIRLQARPMRDTLRLVLADGSKATVGLAVSVVLALGLPLLAGALDSAKPNPPTGTLAERIVLPSEAVHAPSITAGVLP